MKHSPNLILLFALQVFAVQLFAQISYEVRVVQTINDSFLDLDIEIKSTGEAFVLSTSSFFLDYPTSPPRFNAPAVVHENDGPWDLNSDLDYANIFLSYGIGFLGMTVEFVGGIDDSGAVVPGSWTRIGTLRLTITDKLQSSGLTWRSIGSISQVARLVNPGESGGGSTSITTLGSFNSPDDLPLPVELSSFIASNNQGIVTLKWQTKTEVNNYGFEVERSLSPTSRNEFGTGSSQREGAFKWTKIGFVPGKENSITPIDYSLTDKYPTGGSKFVYRLKQIDNNGRFEYSKEVEVELVLNEFILYQNYPNPFNPETNIKFALPKTAKVTLSVYNLLGEKVAALLSEEKAAGYYDVQFNTSNLSTGVYIYRLTTGNFTQTKKMSLIK